jgi:hypothetical protein
MPVEEVHLSMEVVPDRTAVKSSRASLQNGLDVGKMRGPMRSDSQAGASRRRDRHVTTAVDGERQGLKRPDARAKSKRQQHRSSGATSAS